MLLRRGILMEKTISVPKARRILGKQAEHYSDNQVKEIVQTLKLLAREQLGYNGSKHYDKSNE
jgi:hypothetical protein